MAAARRSHGPVFAVIRLDGDARESQVTAKEVVSTEAEAIAEVERLNALNPDEPPRYVWQATRQVSVGEAD
jgi:hypothetical protein